MDKPIVVRHHCAIDDQPFPNPLSAVVSSFANLTKVFPGRAFHRLLGQAFQSHVNMMSGRHVKVALVHYCAIT